MDKPKSMWVFAKAFLDEESGICVEVNKAETPKGATKYSVRIGRLVWKDKNEKGMCKLPKEGEEHRVMLVPFITAFRDFSSMVHVKLQKSFAEPMARITAEAEEWIVTEMAAANEERLEYKREKEIKQASYGKAPTKVTGKTAKKRERERARVQKSA